MLLSDMMLAVSNSRRCKTIGAAIALALGLFLLAPASAHAYIDPGTGSYLLQALVAGAMGGAMALKLYWQKVKAFFSRSDGDSARRDD